MWKERGILLLADPIRGGSRFSQMHIEGTGLVFDESEPCFAQAQRALQKMRREYSWVCAAASGAAVSIALALAAQLPVDRLALWKDDTPALRPRQLVRLDAFARRNLSLIVSEILLVDADDHDARRLCRGLGRRSGVRCVCSEELKPGDLTEDWNWEMFSARH